MTMLVQTAITTLCVLSVFFGEARSQKTLELPDNKEGTPVPRWPTWTYYNPHYRMSFCAIPKNMSTMMKLMFCDLQRISRNQTVKYDGKPNESVGICFHTLPWVRSMEISTGAPWKTKLLRRSKGKGKGVHVLIVRDPLDRFISSFCHLCRRNNQCGKTGQSVLATIQAISRVLTNKEYGEKLRPDTLQSLQGHFAPQVWFCHSGDEDAKRNVKFLRYSQDQEANIAMIDELFEEVGISEDLRDKVLTRMMKERTSHAGNVSERVRVLREIQRDPKILEWIIRVYRVDYEQFDFPIPKSIDDIQI